MSPHSLGARVASRQADHEIALHYQPSREHVLNLGHTVEAEFEAGSTLEYDGEVYELRYPPQ